MPSGNEHHHRYAARLVRGTTTTRTPERSATKPRYGSSATGSSEDILSTTKSPPGSPHSGRRLTTKSWDGCAATIRGLIAARVVQIDRRVRRLLRGGHGDSPLAEVSDAPVCATHRRAPRRDGHDTGLGDPEACHNGWGACFAAAVFANATRRSAAYRIVAVLAESEVESCCRSGQLLSRARALRPFRLRRTMP